MHVDSSAVDRTAQVQTIVGKISSVRGSKILPGDLPAGAGAAELRFLPTILKDGWTLVGAGSEFTISSAFDDLAQLSDHCLGGHRGGRSTVAFIEVDVDPVRLLLRPPRLGHRGHVPTPRRAWRWFGDKPRLAHRPRSSQRRD
jgi:hypothetical protein